MKRPILIYGAMSVELNFLIEKLEDVKTIEHGKFKFYNGYFNDYPVIINIGGVGVINASSDIMYAINKFNPICVLNIGIVGSYSKNIHKGDLIIGEKCLNINSYKTDYLKSGSDFKKWDYITFKEGVDELIFEHASNKLIDLFNEVSHLYKNGNCINGVIGSGDSWNNEIERLSFLNEKYGLVCSDMESIGLYSVCNSFSIPVLSLKIVSDNIILGEEYDRNVCIYINDVFIKYISCIIKKINFLN